RACSSAGSRRTDSRACPRSGSRASSRRRPSRALRCAGTAVAPRSASPAWRVVVALGLMCLSMAVRAVAWHAILRAAMPQVRLRPADALQGTFIGVLMSATLPARLGEPSRALIVARRTGRPREHLPTVIGTIVSQTLLNVAALVMLGIVMFSTVSVFSERHKALVLFAVTPLVILAAVLVAPAVLRTTGTSRSRRAQAWMRRVRSGAAQLRQ